MNIAICGGTGLIGSALVDHWLAQGDKVTVISRAIPDHRKAGANYVTWEQVLAQPELLQAPEVIVNLAGETINQRWTAAAKARILQSRLHAARQVTSLVDRLANKPSVVIQASAVGIYGTSDTATFDEESPIRSGGDFLSDVVAQWEQAADRINVTRIVKLRIGPVLSKNGGAYPKIRFPYQVGAGGRVGSGKQWFSWIHIEDMVRLVDYCIHDQRISGPVNATAPQPVTNDGFGRALGDVLKRLHLFPVPSFVMKLMFGEMSELLLKGQRVLPTKALQYGFEFRYGEVEDALNQLES